SLPDGVPADETKQLRDRLLHTFGNLTLVTARLNPAMSNSAWATKKAALSEHGALALNRKLCALQMWDEAAIKRRAIELFNLAKTVWPKPVVASAVEEQAEQSALNALLKDTLSQNDASSSAKQGEQGRSDARSSEADRADSGGQQREEVIAH